ncbi:MAG: UDP-N-acetylmuramoyl-tripeptide--D-alanyl-D-alanine ligase [Candidatus Omnitrophota bacterium]
MLISDFKQLECIVKPVNIYNLYHFRGIEGFSIDSRKISKGYCFIALKGSRADGHNFISEAVRKGASCIIAERYLPHRPKTAFFVVEDSFACLRSLIKFIRRIKRPFIFAITGSVGKSTTKEMLSFLIEDKYPHIKNIGTENNIFGVAKTMFALRNEKTVIIELGTNSPGEIGDLASITTPDVGIITAIKPVHLEKFKSLRGIFNEKISLIRSHNAIIPVLNSNDRYLGKVNSKKALWFGSSFDSNVYARLVRRNCKESVFKVCNKYRLNMPFVYEGFINNVLAALLAASIKKLEIKDLVCKMNNFKGYLESRMQFVRKGRFIVINDAYNANPYSFKQALSILKQFPNPKAAVIGDMLELGNKSIYYHKLLSGDIIKSGVMSCLAVGKYTQFLKGELKNKGFRNFTHFKKLKDMAKCIDRKFPEGTVIFLKGSRAMQLDKIIKYLK